MMISVCKDRKANLKFSTYSKTNEHDHEYVNPTSHLALVFVSINNVRESATQIGVSIKIRIGLYLKLSLTVDITWQR